MVWQAPGVTSVVNTLCRQKAATDGVDGSTWLYHVTAPVMNRTDVLFIIEEKMLSCDQSLERAAAHRWVDFEAA